MTSLLDDPNNLIGLSGRIVTPIMEAGGLGEVQLSVRGGSEVYLCRCREPLEKHQPVLVVSDLGARTVIVLPWADPTESLLEISTDPLLELSDKVSGSIPPNSNPTEG